jgi:hypothetical protein
MPKLPPGTGAPILFAALITAGAPLCAENRSSFSVDQLETVSVQMSPEGYHRVYRRNQHLLRKQVKTYTKDTLRAAGIPDPVSRFLGAAAGVAMGNDPRLGLARGKSTRLGLEFRDVIQSDRGVVLELRLKW